LLIIVVYIVDFVEIVAEEVEWVAAADCTADIDDIADTEDIAAEEVEWVVAEEVAEPADLFCLGAGLRKNCR